jgi:hypothetical protein
MIINSNEEVVRRKKRDFRRFWAGQVISNLGSSFTSFALPLLTFKLTGSAINLGLAFAVNMLPYLLFGLVIGALVDRLNRKLLMIVSDLLRACAIALLPLLASIMWLNVWWIYAVIFISSTLSICFDSANFAALPSLVDQNKLMAANGQIQASYSFAGVIGPLLAALLLVVVSVPMLLLCDAFSFLLSAGSLALVRMSFNPETEERKERTSLFQAIAEGLRYVLTHPVLSWLTLLLVFVNLIIPAVLIQFVLFAKQVLFVSDAQLAVLYSAGSIGIVGISLVAGQLRKHLSYSFLALGALMLQGLSVIALALLHWYWAVLVLWTLQSGWVVLFDIANVSLGQTIIPNYLLGRVVSFVKVLTWSISPLGALLGGFLIERTKNVSLVYVWLGILMFAVAFAFVFTPLGHIER